MKVVILTKFQSGQICMSTERIVVQRGVAGKFRELLVDSAEKMFGKNTPAPVLVASAAVEKNNVLVADALSKGATVLFGDITATETSPSSMRPLLVDGVTKQMDMYTTESFGPTVSLIEVDSEEEAVAVANDTEYGLNSAVFTGNLFRGLRVARQIESG